MANFSKIDNLTRIRRIPQSTSNIETLNVLGQISYAINKNLKIDMFYADEQSGEKVLRGYRSVSPVAVGSHVTSGNSVFRAYLNEGVSKSKRIPRWRLFRVDRIQSLRIHFSPNKARFDKNFRQGDKHIGTIVTESKVNKRK